MSSGSPAEGVGRRIRDVRLDAGLSQAALAERLRVTQATISNWEAGNRHPSVEDLYVVAGQLGVDIVDLLPRANTPVRAALRAVAEKLDLEELASDVDAFLDRAETVEHPTPLFRPKAAQPVIVAQEIIDQMEITAPPVAIEAVAEACGVPVVEWDFGDDNLSGLVVDTKQGPVIGINSSHARTRRRFSIGHELGHVLLRHLDTFHVDLGVATEHGEPPGYNWRQERAANDFSAALLMPPVLVRAASRHMRAVEELAKRFDVSELAMGFRLAHLGLR